MPPLVRPDVARDYVFVDDVATAFLSAASRTDIPRGSVLNVGSGVQTSLVELVEIVQEMFAMNVKPKWGDMPNRPWDVTKWVADISTTRRLIDGNLNSHWRKV